MWIKLYRAGAATLIVLVALQALIAGQHIFGEWGIVMHGVIGNVVFTIALVMAAVAIFKLDSRTLVVVTVLMVILVSAQIGLGYSARESDSAAALHIPLGVATFGALTYQLLAAWPGLIARTTGEFTDPV
ncbi:MAG: hypothetical protein ACC652_01415 [Acidimicrobiales bacterium]